MSTSEVLKKSFNCPKGEANAFARKNTLGIQSKM